MRGAPLLLALLICLGISCGRKSPLRPDLNSRLVVFVHWESTPLAGKRLDIVQLGTTRLTDDSGIAEFLLPAGVYTLRAYEINRGGPVPAFFDTPVETLRGQTTRVEIVDCLPCVSPTRRISRP